MKGRKRSQGKNHGQRENLGPGITGKYIPQSEKEFENIFKRIAEEQRKKHPKQNHVETPRKEYPLTTTTKPLKKQNIISGRGLHLTIKYLAPYQRNRTVEIYPHAEEPWIYSCRIIHIGKTAYILRRFSTENFATPVVTERFDDLYHTPWIRDNDQAQEELDGIREILRLEIERITSHLKITSLDGI